MKEFLEKVKTQEFKLSNDTTIQQTDRNNFSRELIDNFTTYLQDNFPNLEILRTTNGIGINIPNDDLGAIPIELKITVKNLEFDIFSENEAYNEKISERERKAKEKEEKKKKAIKK